MMLPDTTMGLPDTNMMIPSVRRRPPSVRRPPAAAAAARFYIRKLPIVRPMAALLVVVVL